MPLPVLLAVTAPAEAALLSGRAQAGSCAQMTAAQAEAHKARLVELLKKGRWQDALNLNEAKGKERLDLGGADLTDADLADVDLSGANLSGANLTGALLFGGSLSGANLSGADLAGADLTDTILHHANLANSNLTSTNLSGAWLFGADFTNTNLTDADLEGASIPNGFLTPNTRLDAVPWRGTPAGWQILASARGARFIPLPKA